MRKSCMLLSALLMLLSVCVWAGAPDGYYDAAKGKSGYALKTALHQIIKSGYKQQSYDALWEHFKTTDVRSDGKVWDMYGDCDFTFGTHKCGNYSSECDCYNREHSFPKSWFNDGYPMYTDLFHLYPTDGYVNGRRGNNPFGEVDDEDATYTSNNGGKLGPNSTGGFSGTVFEPVDEFKGDFARTYFYMATRYQDKIASWSQCQAESVCDGTSDRAFTDWTVALLLKWHRLDPVSEKETARNDVVYGIQKNRNPFIDHPELIEKIWGDDNTAWGEEPAHETPDKPEFADLSDTYTDSALVKITCTTEGADIYYRTTNSEFEKYQGEFYVYETTRVTAYAEKDGQKSDNATHLYKVNQTLTANTAAQELFFEVTPNPSNGTFKVKAPQGSRIEVLTSAGVLVRDLQAKNQVFKCSVDGSGLYIIRVTEGGRSAVKKIIVK